MLHLSQSSDVGRLEFTMDEDTKKVSDTRFFPKKAPEWVNLPFLDEALHTAFSTGGWSSIGNALKNNPLPADMYSVVYDHLVEWDNTPKDMAQARSLYITRLITELARRALVFSDELLCVYGYRSLCSAHSTPRAKEVDVFSLMHDVLRVEYIRGVGVSFDNHILNGSIVMTTFNGYAVTNTEVLPSIEYATEKEVREALHQTGIDEKIAWHIASAVQRLIAIDPERFSIPV